MRVSPFLLVVLVAGGCAGSTASLADRLTLPDRNTLVRDQLVIHSDFTLAAAPSAVRGFAHSAGDLCRRLALPVLDEPIHVYLFETEDRFKGFMRLHYPQFPDRRAFFVETDTQLKVYTQWGDRMGEDLRHEVTHAYLHAVVPHVPLWLDEGIAEFYEVPRDRQGVHDRNLERLRTRIEERRWQPDLRRLEQLAGSQEMTKDDYAEAWAWVHFLSASDPEYLELLRVTWPTCGTTPRRRRFPFVWRPFCVGPTPR